MNRQNSANISLLPHAKSSTVIKKYPNRRLYDTATSSYVTLEDLCNMVKQGIEFTVIDAKSEEDLTGQVLTQIILEQESKGYSLLPVKFLRNIISFYGGKMQQVLPSYLEASMENFTLNQDKMSEYVRNAVNFSPFTQFEEIGKQNMALFKQAFSMFNPFVGENEAGEQERKIASGNKKV
ncbi:MAG: polyhydroxyalkanoate synthesis repressor PhaR [Pseudomonadota bacterium]